MHRRWQSMSSGKISQAPIMPLHLSGLLFFSCTIENFPLTLGNVWKYHEHYSIYGALTGKDGELELMAVSVCFVACS